MCVPERCLSLWSIFENFSLIRMKVGATRLSTAKSLKLMWRVASYAACPGSVILPALNNPKKHIVQAAHCIIVSGSLSILDHSALTLQMMDGVIGSLVLVAKPNTWTFLMPSLTAAVLSHLAMMHWPFQFLPHTAHTITSGANSLVAIGFAAHSGGHYSWIHYLPLQAPKPRKHLTLQYRLQVSNSLPSWRRRSRM